MLMLKIEVENAESHTRRSLTLTLPWLFVAWLIGHAGLVCGGL